jgi:hypothetical protein
MHCSHRHVFCTIHPKNGIYLVKISFKWFIGLPLSHIFLTYCPIIVSCASASNINKILKIQKKAIRIVTKNSYTEHTQPIFHSLKILPYDKLIHFAKLKFMHSVVYRYCPSCNRHWERGWDAS